MTVESFEKLIPNLLDAISIPLFLSQFFEVSNKPYLKSLKVSIIILQHVLRLVLQWTEPSQD